MTTNDVFIRIPVIAPNRPNGVVTINCGNEGDYPKGTQPDAFVLKTKIIAVEPAGIDMTGNPIQGCDVFLHGKPCPIRAYMTAEEFAKLFLNV